MFTLGARALVPGHRHKMVLCSDTGYPTYKGEVGEAGALEFWEERRRREGRVRVRVARRRQIVQSRYSHLLMRTGL